jgi:hypothetical protein
MKSADLTLCWLRTRFASFAILVWSVLARWLRALLRPWGFELELDEVSCWLDVLVVGSWGVAEVLGPVVFKGKGGDVVGGFGAGGAVGDGVGGNDIEPEVGEGVTSGKKERERV